MTSSSVGAFFWSFMALELSQLHRLLQNPVGSTVAGVLPASVAQHFGCTLGIAYLSSKSRKHIVTDHADIQLLDVLHMPDMISNGLWIADRPNSACVVYSPPDTTNLHYASGLKVVGGGFEPYMCSFYRIGTRQITAKRRRGLILQEQR